MLQILRILIMTHHTIMVKVVRVQHPIVASISTILTLQPSAMRSTKKTGKLK